MELAVQHRPGWTEVVGVLAACAVLLAGLAILDNRAARSEGARAQRVLAAQARAAASERRAHPAATAPRTESLGSGGPIVIPIGGAWSAGTTAAKPAPHAAAARPGNVLLIVMAGFGALTALAGAVLLSRSRA